MYVCMYVCLLVCLFNLLEKIHSKNDIVSTKDMQINMA